MTTVDRAEVQNLVVAAVVDGARQSLACKAVGVAARTLQRWHKPSHAEDRRHGPLTASQHALTPAEREKIISISASPEFCNMSPHQIVPTLADRGEFVGSESSFYRVLKAENLLAHRGRAKPAAKARPRAFLATAPRQLFSWDITYLRSQIRGQYFYLYLFLDIFSRKIVGAEVHDRESMDHSSVLIDKICKAEGIEKNQIAVHADNGGAMKGCTMVATMQRLGILPSFSRPSVSDDNPFSESLFKTLKYCPLYPAKPFASIEDARAWVEKFIAWYNNEHLHSAISFTTPQSRHDGADIAILKQREIVYENAQQKNPTRWSGATRNWKKINCVKLNCLKEDELPVTPANIRSVS